MQRLKHIASFTLVKLTLAILLVIGLVGLSSFIANAMPNQVLTNIENSVLPSNLSPNPGLLRLYDNNGNSWGGSMFTGGSPVSSTHGFKHVLKNEVSSNVRRTRLHVYYPTQAAAQSDTFILKSDHCNFTAKNGSNGPPVVNPDGNNNNPFPAGANKHVIEFDINNTRSFREPATPNNEPVVCGDFNNASWPVVGSPTLDQYSGLYYNKLEFTLEGNRYTGGGQKVMFQIGSANGGTMSLDGGANNTDFGIGEEPGSGGSNLSLVAGLPFGLACSYGASIFPDALVQIYDPDPNGFGDSYVFIEKRAEPTPTNPNPAWIKLSQGEYSVATNVHHWDNGSSRWVISGYGTGVTATLKIGEFSKAYDYILVYDNPYSGAHQPSANVLSVSLPGDSISTQTSCRYDLTPSVSVSPTQITAGQTLTVKGDVTNSGPLGVAPGNHTWQMYVAKYSQRPSTFTGGLNDQPPCNVLPSANRYGCQQFSSDYTYPASQSSGSLPFTTDAADPVGANICFITRVLNPTDDPSDDSYWRYSAMQCSIVGKRPKIQVLGGDAKIGKNIDTSLSSVGNPAPTKYYGSWGEYGVFSDGKNKDMASGAGLLGGNVYNTQSEWKALTFGNNAPYGNFNGGIAPSFSPGTTEAISNVLGGATYGSGAKHTYQYSGTLLISGDQIYNDSGYTNISDIPNIKIIADNIIIGAGVQRIDAWLIARSSSGVYGSISTCSTVPGFLPYDSSNLVNSTVCNVPLKINGPIIADKLYNYRTADQPTGTPAAETYNLRANNILSSYVGRGNGTPVARTELITEAPPRF